MKLRILMKETLLCDCHKILTKDPLFHQPCLMTMLAKVPSELLHLLIGLEYLNWSTFVHPCLPSYQPRICKTFKFDVKMHTFPHSILITLYQVYCCSFLNVVQPLLLLSSTLLLSFHLSFYYPWGYLYFT